ncbi:MAG: endolytic transglycosylase MltG [Actinomycetes bacterium]
MTGPVVPPTARPRWIRITAVVVVVALVLSAGAAVAGWLLVDPPGGPGEEVTVTIPSGASVAAIGTRLADAGVVPNAFAFRMYARATGAGPFQAGEYRIARDAGVPAAIRALDAGPRIEYQRLALPPGMTLAMIAAVVGTLPGRSAERFLQVAASGAVRSRYQPEGTTSLEGLTWPDTYYVTPDEDETVILQRIVDRFDAELRRLRIPAKAAARGERPYTATIVASLIQGEAGVEADRPLISGVIANRLARDMPLQIDATLLFARGDRGPLTDADFARPGPYNTYQVGGLPPTPIMTVGAASLNAAVAPAAVPYLYYVLWDEDGGHRFAETYAEHLANIADARRRGIL